MWLKLHLIDKKRDAIPLAVSPKNVTDSGPSFADARWNVGVFLFSVPPI